MSGAGQTAIHRRVALLQSGQDPTLIQRMHSGWAVLGEQQFLRGYAMLLPDPVVGTFNELAPALRAQAILDAGRLGDALLAVTGALRINYAIFSNQQLDSEIVDRVNVNLGTTDGDSGTAAATGGTINLVTNIGRREADAQCGAAYIRLQQQRIKRDQKIEINTS